MELYGYDAKEAARSILAGLQRDRTLGDIGAADMERLVLAAQRLEARLMRERGLVAEDGLPQPDVYYDEDDAYEYVTDALVEEESAYPTPIGEMRLAAFVDAYMELSQDYMEQKGLLTWEDH